MTLTLAASERHLVTVRELLSLTYAPLLKAVRAKKPPKTDGALDEEYFDENKQGMLTLLRAMAKAEGRFGGILAAIGHRFLATPVTERGSIFSTAAAQTDFLDSLPLRRISRRSDFRLATLRGERPTSIFLCLPVGRMESHYRWLRLVVAATTIATIAVSRDKRRCHYPARRLGVRTCRRKSGCDRLGSGLHSQRHRPGVGQVHQLMSMPSTRGAAQYPPDHVTPASAAATTSTRQRRQAARSYRPRRPGWA